MGIPALRRNQALISSVYHTPPRARKKKKNLTMIRLCKKFNYKINKFDVETLNIKYSNKYLHIYRYNLTINGISLLPEFCSVYTEHIDSSKKKLNSNNTLCSRLHGQFKKPRTLGSQKSEVSQVLCTRR